MPGQAVSNPELLQEWSQENSVDTNFNAPPLKPVVPDWSQNKKLAKYFNRPPSKAMYPTWLYNHKTGESKIFETAEAAAEVGVSVRHRTEEEAQMYGGAGIVWNQGSEWKTAPAKGERVYDPRKPEYGKEYQPAAVSAATSNRQMLTAVLPELTAAVVSAMRQEGIPKSVSDADIEEFLAFKTWKKTLEAAEKISAPWDVKEEHEKAMETTMALEGVVDEKAAWIRQAEESNIKVDKRWSLERIKSEVEKGL